ncbi:deoxyribonuclease-1-like [Channa argus]|uniref:deoxyribonuclease-1-like n=1 Tax=Channa argus TaxID=215402 RepID=UPI003520E093
MKIAAFNTKNLGMSKVKNDEVRTHLIKIASRYSVIVMLEVRDKTGEVMDMFLSELNKDKDNKNRPFAIECSEPLGRGSHTERFVFLYRKTEMEIMDSYQYKEPKKDLLTREPFAVWFRCSNTVVQDLVLIPVHTRPQDTEMELHTLHDVVTRVKKRWGIENIMILGDFNADGRYFSEKDKKQLSIFRPPYHWLIDDDVNTTTSNHNDNTYDRIVVYGDDMYEGVVDESAQAFNFQAAYKLSDAEAEAISDHYPVEVELKEVDEEEDEDDEEYDEEDDEEDDDDEDYC